MKSALSFLFIFNFYSLILFSQTATPPSVGDGSSGNPYQIATLENLYWISNSPGEWNKYFLQTANIDASETVNWDTTGWLPIADFSGTYDGGGHSVSNLYINRPTSSYIGLFGKNNREGNIKRVGLTNVNVKGYYYVGALVGLNLGVIENCYATGLVTGLYAWIGGLVGGNNGPGIISGCYSHANATGGECVGSLSGENFSNGTIQNSYAMGVVKGSTSVGGLSGTNYLSTIINSYSTGVSSDKGLIGFGGGTCTNSFWDTTSSGKSASEGGIGKSTDEMKTIATYTDSGWDFVTIWEMIGTNYPRLRAIPDSSLAVGIITETYNPTQFLLCQNYPNPFNPSTKIKFEIPTSTLVRLVVYDLLGREVIELLNKYLNSGSYETEFKPRDLSSGVYFYNLKTDNYSDTKKLILLR